MGAFNTVRTRADCPRCCIATDVTVQFKYGDIYQHHYRVGDTLRWGGNDKGVPGTTCAVVNGIAETACFNCGYDDWYFYVFVERDIITSVISADGRYDFVGVGKTFLVIRP